MDYSLLGLGLISLVGYILISDESLTRHLKLTGAVLLILGLGWMNYVFVDASPSHNFQDFIMPNQLKIWTFHIISISPLALSFYLFWKRFNPYH